MSEAWPRDYYSINKVINSAATYTLVSNFYVRDEPTYLTCLFYRRAAWMTLVEAWMLLDVPLP